MALDRKQERPGEPRQPPPTAKRHPTWIERARRINWVKAWFYAVGFAFAVGFVGKFLGADPYNDPTLAEHIYAALSLGLVLVLIVLALVGLLCWVAIQVWRIGSGRMPETTDATDATDDWTVSVLFPDGWLLLPRPGEFELAPPLGGRWDKARWAVTEAWSQMIAEGIIADHQKRQETAGTGEPGPATEPAGSREAPGPAAWLGEILVVHLRMAWEANPIGAAVLVPEPAAGVVASMMVRQVTPDETGPDLAEMRRVKESPTPELVRPRECTEVDLPMGPALRVHEVFRDLDAEPGEPLTESVTHFVAVCASDGQHRMVELMVQWHPGAGENLDDHADEIARTLEFVPL